MYEIAEVEEVTGSVLVLLEVGVEGEGEGVVVVEVTWRIEQTIRGARAADAMRVALGVEVARSLDVHIMGFLFDVVVVGGGLRERCERKKRRRKVK